MKQALSAFRLDQTFEQYIERVAAKDSPIPFAPILEKEILPDDQDVLDAARHYLDPDRLGIAVAGPSSE